MVIVEFTGNGNIILRSNISTIQRFQKKRLDWLSLVVVFMIAYIAKPAWQWKAWSGV